MLNLYYIKFTICKIYKAQILLNVILLIYLYSKFIIKSITK